MRKRLPFNRPQVILRHRQMVVCSHGLKSFALFGSGLVPGAWSMHSVCDRMSLPLSLFKCLQLSLHVLGAFQKYYATDLLRNETSSNISWIGSVQAFLMMLGGSLAGPLFDRGYLRHLVAAGSFFVILGLFMTSLARNEWEIFLAQGLTVGIGSGLLFVPSVSTVLTYFSKKRALAMGITACGSSVGTLTHTKEALPEMYAHMPFLQEALYTPQC